MRAKTGIFEDRLQVTRRKGRRDVVVERRSLEVP
jgi:hypothetical protein